MFGSWVQLFGAKKSDQDHSNKAREEADKPDGLTGSSSSLSRAL